MNKIIAAVSDAQAFENAMKSKVDTIFYLAPNINTLTKVIEAAHREEKKLFIHMDMAEGIGKDRFGVEYVYNLGVDGIISTRSNIIKIAKKYDLKTVQRFFVIDAHSVETTVDTANNTLPDMIEVMPGIATKVIEKINGITDFQIIAGGLIETQEEVDKAIKIGAFAISTSNIKLWDCVQ